MFGRIRPSGEHLDPPFSTKEQNSSSGCFLSVRKFLNPRPKVRMKPIEETHIHMKPILISLPFLLFSVHAFAGTVAINRKRTHVMAASPSITMK